MRRADVSIPAPDGHASGTLHVPDGDGPWPGVLVFPAAGGARATFRRMGDRLASLTSVLTDSGAGHAVEFCPARHGFAVPGNPACDAEADTRHWEALRTLYQAHLQGA
jgi:dienelactone hydrolase